tara:strand:+ start:266 stop:478 length:213 start_codon:yes stop_codon:yes gene_type:complete
MLHKEKIIEHITSEISQLENLIKDIGEKTEQLVEQQEHCKHLLQGFEWYLSFLKGEKIDIPDQQIDLDIE